MIAFPALLLFAVAVTDGGPTRAELAAALTERGRAVRASDVRIVRCVAPEEEPTEYRCSWRERDGRSWRRRDNWFAIDGSGWRVID